MLSKKLSIEDIGDQIREKRVLVRVDFNVPFDNEGNITDMTRIRACLPTINYIRSKGAKCVILISHLGRPDGRFQHKFSLIRVAKALQTLLQTSVTFLDNCVGQVVQQTCQQATSGQILLLQNLRFHVEEEGKGKNENGNVIKADKAATQKFCDELTSMCDIFVNDAFGTAHRAHSSMVGICAQTRVCGLLMYKELQYFSQVLEEPKRPLLAILGGAKVKDKIKLIYNMLDKVDKMILGGGLAFTFMKVLYKMEIGSSLFDEDGSLLVEDIMKKSKERNVEIFLPKDFVCADKFDNFANKLTITHTQNIPNGWMGLDSGPLTIQEAKHVIMSAKTIVWNGAQGVFEFPNFATGSLAFLDYVCEATKQGCVSIVGGGETVALVEQAGKTSFVSHASTGGGASLELLEGNVLPGVEHLSDK